MLARKNISVSYTHLARNRVVLRVRGECSCPSYNLSLIHIFFVSKQDFQALCLAHPQVALKVLRVVGARLRRLVGIIEELSFTTVRHRLASFLVRLAQKEGKRTAEGVEITVPVSNQELASQIGTVRELVSRNLSRLQAEGMIKIDGRSVTICDWKALEAELQSAE